MSTINLQLNDRLRQFAESQAALRGFASTSEFVESLIAREERKWADIEQLESELKRGVESGQGIEVNDHFWEQKRSSLLAKHRH